MSATGSNPRLTALLAEAGWSDAALARAVNALAAAQGLQLNYSRASVAHWRRGSRPPAPVPALAAQAFTRRIGRPVSPHDTGLAQLTAHEAAQSPPQTDHRSPVQQLLTLTRSDIDPAHRTDLQRAAYTLNPTAHTAPTAFAHPLPQHTKPSSADDTTAPQALLQTFTDLTQRHGGRCARTALAAYLADDICTLLTQRADRPEQSRLLTCTAQLTHHLAVMTDDAGHHHLAHRYFTLTLNLAHHAGCRKTYAITLRTMSAQALRLGHLHHARALAENSARTAESTSPTALTSFILIQQALIAAHDRQPPRARELMQAAQDRHEQSAAPPDPFNTYPLAALHYQRAAILRTLGQHAHALAALQTSMRHRDPDDHRSLALSHAHTAEIHLHLKNLDAACTHWHKFLAFYAYLRSWRADQALAHLRQSLLPHRNYPPAKDVLDRAQHMSRNASFKHSSGGSR
ncbi:MULTISPECIES: tetratricopeptide repeat protein [Streptomyces]|uniref:hypothetical protein n=1 Tax=Streptomyces TaxID=1883 RepID=UPI0005180313|nr:MULTISPECIES: hypothetical protein [Streptomyces]